MMLEKEIEKIVCDYAKTKGYEVYKFSSPNRVGVPDRMFIGPGQQLFFIEFKAPGKRPTAVQNREAKKIALCGFKVWLIDNPDDGKALIDQRVEMAGVMEETRSMMRGLAALVAGVGDDDESEAQVKH
jgi:hypothetical protein